MKAKIIGNTNSLQNKINSFMDNQKIELKNTRSRTRKYFVISTLICLAISFIMTTSVCVFLLRWIQIYNTVICYALSITIGIVLSFIVCLLFIYLFKDNIFFLRYLDEYFWTIHLNDSEIEAEIEDSARSRYGEKLSILKAYENNNLLSMKVGNVIYVVQPTMNITFEFIKEEKLIETITILFELNRTSDKKFEDVLQLDMETGTAIFYYKDDIKEGQKIESKCFI